MDFNAHRDNNKNLKNALTIILFGRGFHLLLFHRIQVLLTKVPLIGTFFARCLKYVSNCMYNSDISLYCTINGGVCIPHATGIIIGDNVKIDSGVTISNGVTLDFENRTTPEYPTICKSVYLDAGCSVLGNVTVSENAQIGFNTVITKNVPANSIVSIESAEIEFQTSD